MPTGDRTGVARFYLTPPDGWRTTERTLANPGEWESRGLPAVTVNSAEILGA
ncbi:hypothetical protein GCM10009757_44500 [Streptomyces cheonanensis]|uniref:Uncharacterized protein n=1 Tax=Streptomyces cheonanensis TaxID=312720 RepID=A0ABN2VFQ4_9ACTN